MTVSKTRRFVAVCDSCGIHTEERHTLSSARRLCRMHNFQNGCDAEPVPVCWVCHERAMYRSTVPPHEYTCKTHVMGIDMEPIEDGVPFL